MSDSRDSAGLAQAQLGLSQLVRGLDACEKRIAAVDICLILLVGQTAIAISVTSAQLGGPISVAGDMALAIATVIGVLGLAAQAKPAVDLAWMRAELFSVDLTAATLMLVGRYQSQLSAHEKRHARKTTLLRFGLGMTAAAVVLLSASAAVDISLGL